MKHLFLAFAAVGLLIACTPKTAEIVPVVTETETTEESMPLADIGEGKVIWLTDCTKCHYGQKVIEDYTKLQWEGILPKMIKNAKLNDDKARQIRAYVYWELEN
ncbi:MAG: hypothetical protein ACI837_001632 [Crocinitomicaceae bacterium]|jgi:hypothetical protein